MTTFLSRMDSSALPRFLISSDLDNAKNQRLIDSILRGWNLPKFYFVAVSDDNFLVEDGQQRLAAIFDFFRSGQCQKPALNRFDPARMEPTEVLFRGGFR